MRTGNIFCLIQWKPLNVIILVSDILDHINRIMTITNCFYLVFLVKEALKSGYRERLIIVTEITITAFTVFHNFFNVLIHRTTSMLSILCFNILSINKSVLIELATCVCNCWLADYWKFFAQLFFIQYFPASIVIWAKVCARKISSRPRVIADDETIL